MRLGNHFKIAFKNINKKPIYLKLMFSYFIISFFLLVFLLNCFIIEGSKSNILNQQSENNKAQMIVENYLKTEVFDEEYIKDTYISTSITSGFSITKINIDDKEINKRMTIIGEMIDYSKMFPQFLVDNYEKKNNESIIIGNIPKENNQILINESMVLNLGFDGKELIGKHIDLCFERKMGNLISEDFIRDAEIVGIIKDKFIDVYEQNYIIVSKDIEMKNFPNKELYNLKSIIIYFNDFKDIDLRINELNEKYGVSFVASNYEAIDMYEKLEKYGGTLIKIFLVFLAMIFAGFFSLTLSLSYMEYAESRKQYQVLFNYGLSRKSITGIVFLQHLIAYLFSYILSILSSSTIVLIVINKIDSYSNGVLILNFSYLIISCLISLFFGVVLISIIVYVIVKIGERKYSH